MKKYDLIVVGGGILGAFHAYFALKKGLKVLLIEKDSQSSGSTVQNFGQVVPSGLAGQWFDYGRESLAIYEEIQNITDISVRKNGSIYVASTPLELDLIHELSELFLKKKYENYLLSKAGLIKKTPNINANYALGAIVFPQELSVEPDRMIHELLAYMKDKMNLKIQFGCSAIFSEESDHEIIIKNSDSSTFCAENLLVCSGTVANLMFPEIIAKSGLKLSKLQMMKTIPMPEIKLPGNILTGLTIQRYESFQACESYSKLDRLEQKILKDWGIHILFKQAIDGSIIIGDSHEYFSISNPNQMGLGTKELVDNLIIEEAQKIVNIDLKNNIANRWSGYYSQHPDEIFNFEVSKRIRILTGIGGKGMTSSAGYAQSNIAEWF